MQNKENVKNYPVTVIKNACISYSEIDSQPTSPSRKKKNSTIAIYIIEVLDLFMSRRVTNELDLNLATSICN